MYLQLYNLSKSMQTHTSKQGSIVENHYQTSMSKLPSRQRMRSGHMFSSSDDNIMLNQIRATHAPDGREVEVKPIMHVIEDIFLRAAPTIPGRATQGAPLAPPDTLDTKTFQAGGYRDIMDLLAFTINKISCEISCKCSGSSSSSSGDAHATTLVIFKTLSSYTWDTKVVLALASFAVYYGEFGLVAQLCLTNPLAKSIGILKQLPDIMEHFESLKPKYDAIIHLITAMVNVTKCIVELKDLPMQYISPDTPAYETAEGLIPTASYWTVRSVVACAGQITGLIGMSHEYISSTTEAWELSSLAHKVNSIHEHLMKQLKLCHEHIDGKKQMEAYQNLVHLFEMPHLDNVRILRALISEKEDNKLPLLEGSTKTTVSVDVLRRKNVLLLISDLELPPEELSILYQIYQESTQYPAPKQNRPYEVVWFPVIDTSLPWDQSNEKQFEELQSMMQWYSVHHPSLIHPAVIRYIKEVWHFNKKPLLVVLDSQGKVVNPNAIHMLWIWGSQGFPFTSAREEALWRDETWKIELLADSIDPKIFTWMQEKKYICLYGGDDMNWIQKFTTLAQSVAHKAGVQLEMIYMGKSSPREKIRRINDQITTQNLSHTLPDPNLIWFFWIRVQSMWHSKLQHGKSVENDPIMQEIVTMLSYDAGDEGWAVICRGSEPGMVKGKSEVMMTCFEEFEQWKENAIEKGVIEGIKEYLLRLQTPHHCNRLILPGSSGNVPDRVDCAECGKQMDKFIMYRCCDD